jgi:uncharacterized protein YegJ (DUF2314 family)
MDQRIILGVPGRWPDRGAILAAIAKTHRPPRYLALGAVIMELGSKRGFGFEVYDRDDRLASAFHAASQGRFTAEQLAAIDEHTFTVYLVGNEATRAEAASMMPLATAVLDAGGLAVKVETAGVAHTAERFRHYAAARTTLALYDSMVVLVGGEDFHFSCGMHNFGLPDASVDASLGLEGGAEQLHAFNQWQLLNGPRIKEGDAFQAAETDPAFRLTHHPFGYEPDDLLNNPHGRWHLQPVPPPPNSSRFKSGGEPLFMALGSEDPELRACVEQAQRTLGFFVDHFESPYEWGRYLVKTTLRQGDDLAHMWTLLIEAGRDELTGQMFEAPPQLSEYRAGQKVRIRRADVEDWAIIRAGTLIGGFSLRLKRRHVPAAEQHHYDLYSGTISYAPLEEIPGLT